MLHITSIYAALLAGLYLALCFRVIGFRRANQISLGDGDSKDLRQRTRAQQNFAEYAPIGLILLACVELRGAPALAVHLLGLMLLGGRTFHAVAFWVHPMIMRLRVIGMLLTLIMIAVAAFDLLLHSLI